MKRFRIAFKEVSYGVIEVFANDEETARELAECEGDRFVNKSYMETGEVVSVDEVDE